MDSDARASLERARVREFYRFYPPLVPGVFVEDADNLEPLDPVILPLPQSSPDAALTAFAQLGALRLNTKRALISLFNRESQHILAEATRTLSLQSDAEHTDEDALWLGCSVIPKEKSLCSGVLDLPTHAEQNQVANCVLVIDDVAEEERFRHRSFLPGPPSVRFYAGAPICTPDGVTIGSYCVMDDEPRNGLDARSRRFLLDMAKTIMEHLTLARAQRSQQRSEIMVRGIGQFIEGKTAIHERANSSGSTPHSLTPRTSVDYQGPGHSPVFTKRRESGTSDTGEGGMQKRRTSAKDYPSVEMKHGRKTPTLASRDVASSNVAKIFSRASNVIKEALELDGVVFYEVMIGSSGKHHRRTSYATSASLVASTSGLDEEVLLAPLEKTRTRESVEDSERGSCGVLGFSTATQSSNQGHLVTDTPFSVPASFIRGLVQRYPEGRVIRVDEVGNVKHLGLASAPHMKNAKGLPMGQPDDTLPTRHAEVRTLLGVIPHARNLAFLPLWDFHRERWFAGALIWSNIPTRVLNSEGDLGYLAAFGNSIMAEVSRLDAITADRAKADFISSISHELRSPLHGILGNAEFLQETSLETFQKDMVHSIDICGKTLLDTINHVLDFAKINNSQKFLDLEDESTRDGITGSGKTAGGLLHGEVDLGSVVEEVTDTVFAGHVYRNPSKVRSALKLNHSASSYEHYSMYSPDHDGTGTDSTKHNTVMVILDVDFSPTWQFPTQAGAWRRVLMNALGNSLKYTTSGYVMVKLRGTPSPSDDTIQLVALTVSDTGRGISKQYLTDYLFTAFTQEDPHMAGVGLGLSIMRQVVGSLDGTIEVRSEKDTGTEVEISIPVPRGSGTAMLSEGAGDDLLSRIQVRAKGMRVGLIGFDGGHATPAIEEGKRLLESSLRRLCEDWFGMEVFPIADNADADADIYIATKSGNDSLMDRADEKKDALSAVWRRVERHPIIVIVPDAAVSPREAIQMEKMFHDRIVHFIAQPCGPRKFARALSACFEAQELESQMAIREKRHRGPSSAKYKSNTGRVSGESAQPPTESGMSDEPCQPVTAQNRTSTPVSPASSHGKSFAGSEDKIADTIVTIMLVEDNPVNLRLLEMYMKKMGHAYRTAVDGQKAIEAYKLAEGSIKCVLMDITMPVMDGMEATRGIRQYESEQSLKPATIIALTGLASDAAQQEAFDSGFDLYMIKPVKFQALGEILKKHGH